MFHHVTLMRPFYPDDLMLCQYGLENMFESCVYRKLPLRSHDHKLSANSSVLTLPHLQ
jgi:hypothetical protein